MRVRGFQKKKHRKKPKHGSGVGHEPLPLDSPLNIIISFSRRYITIIIAAFITFILGSDKFKNNFM